MLPNLKGFYESRKFYLATDHWSVKTLFLTHMLSKSDLPWLLRKLTTSAPFYQILSSIAKSIVSYATKPKKVHKIFVGLQAPNIIPTYLHSFQTTTTLQFTLLSTIHQELFILLLPKKVVRASLLKI